MVNFYLAESIMHGFCGWYSLSPCDSGGLENMCRVIAGLEQRHIDAHSVVASGKAGRMLADAQGRIALIVGHPRWGNSYTPNMQDIRANSTVSAMNLLEVWHEHGPLMLKWLVGDFALVIIDGPARRVFAATDRIGRQPLFYAQTDDKFIFASSATAVANVYGTNSTIHLQAVYAYLYFHMVPSPLSIYAGVSKLEGAHSLDWSGRLSTPSCWWIPHFTEDLPTDTLALAKEMKTLIADSVTHLASGQKSGAFLSGGLDSSTVAGMLASSSTSVPIDTFSIGFDVPGYDEILYARIAASHFGTQSHEYYVTPNDVLAAIPRIAAHYDEPFGNSSAVPAYYCAQLARETGIERLLAGDGGDELFAGNERYAKQKVFEAWQILPQPLRQSLKKTVQTLPITLPLAGKTISYIEQAEIDLPERLDSYNFLRRTPIMDVFTAEFIEEIDPCGPTSLLRRIWSRPDSASTLNRMMYLDWQRTLADNDLRKINHTCHMAGVDVVYPLLDDDLVSFSCRVPSRLKLPGRRLRAFYKQAMRGFLPEPVLRKSKHGFGLPFGIWMREHTGLRELAYGSLCALKVRGWLRPEFIDKAIELHRSEHASYYGELIWLLMMLELWAATHI